MSEVIDPINPPHYRRGKYEVIEIILAFFREDYLLGTVLKYILRFGRKGTRLEQIDDLKKAAKFLSWKIEEAEAEEQRNPTIVPLNTGIVEWGNPVQGGDLTTVAEWGSVDFSKAYKGDV